MDDGVTTYGPLATRFPDLTDLLKTNRDDSEAQDRFRHAETIGRPLGGPAFLERVETALGRPVAARKRGPNRNSRALIECTVTEIATEIGQDHLTRRRPSNN